MVDVRFPTLSTRDPDAEGVVAAWFVRDGERVAADQLVAEVQVDKVSMEVPAPGPAPSTCWSSRRPSSHRAP
ncbi:MAG TPA: lipoyl domain-containing protein [Kineosporiaceae bacterium]|nr:lipoyl domain-containing protein [Kineosporiaceae bacterium]